MNPGKLNKKITIQRVDENEDEHEDEHKVSNEKWTNLRKVYCSVKILNGKNDENVTEFEIRYNACKDLSVKDRIEFEGRLFNIVFVDNIEYKNEKLVIKAEEVMT